MSDKKICQEVRAALLEALGDHLTDTPEVPLSKCKIDDDAFEAFLDRKFDDLGLDSLSMLEIVMALEIELEVSLAEDIEESLLEAGTCRRFCEIVQQEYDKVNA